DTDIGASRFDVGVDCGVGSDIGEVDGVGEHCLRSARAGIVNEPFNLRTRTQALLEPALALSCEVVGNEALNVRDIGKVTDTDGLRLSGAHDQRKGKACYKSCPSAAEASPYANERLEHQRPCSRRERTMHCGKTSVHQAEHASYAVKKS